MSGYDFTDYFAEQQAHKRSLAYKDYLIKLEYIDKSDLTECEKEIVRAVAKANSLGLL